LRRRENEHTKMQSKRKDPAPLSLGYEKCEKCTTYVRKRGRNKMSHNNNNNNNNNNRVSLSLSLFFSFLSSVHPRKTSIQLATSIDLASSRP
jgi:hypothetical protein